VAKKVFVTYANLQAEIAQQFSGLKAGVLYQLARGELTWAEAQATDFKILSLSDIKAEVAYRFVRGEITWAEVQAAEISLNYYSLNQYFGPEFLSLADNTALVFSKAAEAEILTLSEAQEIHLQRQLGEALAVTDNATILLVVNREFSDSNEISDLAVLTVSKTESEILTLSEAQEIHLQRQLGEAVAITDNVTVISAFNRQLSDSKSFSDLAVLALEKAAADSIPLSDYLNARVARADHSALNTTPWNTFPPNH
tara:strand:- start:850 stop:1614 length:765 start_codon:yes stop_codon:yes gene_type:complete